MAIAWATVPTKPPRLCAVPGCKTPTRSTRCPAHESTQATERPSARAQGYDSRWERHAKAYLAHHPLCAGCERKGRVTPAAEVDHIVPHRGDWALFWAPENHQPMCKRCHSAKTAREVNARRAGVGPT